MLSVFLISLVFCVAEPRDSTGVTLVRKYAGGIPLWRELAPRLPDQGECALGHGWGAFERERPQVRVCRGRRRTHDDLADKGTALI